MGPAPRTVRWPLPPPGWRGAFPSLWGLFLNPLFALMFQGVPRAGSPQEPLSAGLGLVEPFPGPHLHPAPLSEGHYLSRCHRWTPVHWKFPVGGRTQWVRQTQAGRPRSPALGVSPGPEGPPLLLTTGRDGTGRSGRHPSVRPSPRPRLSQRVGPAEGSSSLARFLMCQVGNSHPLLGLCKEKSLDTCTELGTCPTHREGFTGLINV